MSSPSSRELGPADRFLIGAIGPPGKRAFYLFVETRGKRAWFLFEKTQAAVLGEQGLELISNMGWDDDDTPVDELVAQGSDLPEPAAEGDVLFRVMSIAMRIEGEQEMTMLLEGQEDGEAAAFMITARQLRAASVMSLRAVHSGRAQCPECLLPEDPEGHHCPSGNGHRLPG